ncbi:hypothetical protein [Kitasatospora sp. NPDC057223]|uniref:hypothetical protein n=1 Tax=Kitasatospora sp. NPDC057223 TaxID=3346055 RepID=UPI0036290234
MFYGVDLESEPELDGPRFFSLAQRVGVYGGVIAARIEEQQRDEPGQVRPANERRDGQDEKHMELAAFRLAFPGLVDVARVAQEEVE